MLHWLLQHLIWYLVKFFLRTYRLEYHGRENIALAKSRSKSKSYVLAAWHGQAAALLGALAWTVPYLIMASRSKDGDYAAFVAKKAGLIPVRGSSRKKGKDKGGKEALLTYIEQLRKGVDGALTIDGPKGPRHVCKPGVAVMAQQSGAAILPLCGIPESYWEFNSWDRMRLPKPFSKIHIIFGEPILVDTNSPPEQVEKVCRLVEESLMKIEQSVNTSN